jgi:hypothetical protein
VEVPTCSIRKQTENNKLTNGILWIHIEEQGPILSLRSKPARQLPFSFRLLACNPSLGAGIHALLVDERSHIVRQLLHHLFWLVVKLVVSVGHGDVRVSGVDGREVRMEGSGGAGVRDLVVGAVDDKNLRKETTM